MELLIAAKYYDRHMIEAMKQWAVTATKYIILLQPR